MCGHTRLVSGGDPLGGFVVRVAVDQRFNRPKITVVGTGSCQRCGRGKARFQVDDGRVEHVAESAATSGNGHLHHEPGDQGRHTGELAVGRAPVEPAGAQSIAHPNLPRETHAIRANGKLSRWQRGHLHAKSHCCQVVR